MRRGLGIVGAAFVVALALAPRSADAQQIVACVSNANGAIRIVALNATCSKNEHKLAWGGALAGADFNCVTAELANGQQLTFTYSHTFDGGSFGSAITPHPVIGRPQEFDSFQLQQGIYQIHLSGARFLINPGSDGLITANLTQSLASPPFWLFSIPVSNISDIVGGDRLVTVGPNTTLSTLTFTTGDITQSSICELIIIKLQ